MPLLQVKSLNFSYQKRKVLKNLSFNLTQGQILTILGPNGVGKSTLLGCLSKQLKIKPGEIILAGKDLNLYQPKKLARKVAFVPQKYQLRTNLTVLDFMTTARFAYLTFYQVPAAKEVRQAQKILATLKIENLAERRVNELSGGQMQLVAIAKALLQEPQLLILDEPLAALDFGYQQLMLKLLLKLKKQGFAIIITTHTPDHALYLNDKVGLLYKDQHFITGQTQRIMTTKNLEKLYHCRLIITVLPHSKRRVCLFD